MMPPSMKMNLAIVLFTVAVSTAGIWAFLHNSQHRSDNLSEPHEYEHHRESERDVHGKPGADITLAGPPVHVMELNASKDMVLTLESSHRGEIHVEVSVDSGLHLISDQTEWRFNGHRDTLQIPISIYAAKEGRHLLQLQVVTQDTDSRQEYRSLAVEIRVGQQEHQKLFEKHRVTGETAPTYVPLDAVETIE